MCVRVSHSHLCVQMGVCLCEYVCAHAGHIHVRCEQGVHCFCRFGPPPSISVSVSLSLSLYIFQRLSLSHSLSQDGCVFVRDNSMSQGEYLLVMNSIV